MLLEGVKSTKMLLVLVKKKKKTPDFQSAGFSAPVSGVFVSSVVSGCYSRTLCRQSETQQEKFKVHNPVKHSGLDTATDLAENGLFINVTSSTSLGYS